jgi:hypothetical protein
MGGLQHESAYLGGENKSVALPGFEAHILVIPNRSLVTVQTGGLIFGIKRVLSKLNPKF